jgi:cell wall assembly regulator SMI1
MKRKHFIIGGFLGVVVFLGGGFFLFSKIKASSYPVAPPMPPVVGQTTEEILAQLESVLKEKAPQILTNLQPGLSAEKISELENESGIHFPDEIKALYQWRDGFNPRRIRSGGFQAAGPMPGDNFLPLEAALQLARATSNQVARATLFQRAAFNVLAGYTRSWITVFDDGAGDGYFFDPARKPSEGAVFYHFTEDDEYVFFPSAKNLLAGLVKCYQQNAFAWKDATNGAGLYEDFGASSKIWNEFGVSSSRE